MKTWDDLRAVDGLRLGPAAYRYQPCPKCGVEADTLDRYQTCRVCSVEIDTLLGGGMASHRDFDCQPSFRPQVGPYDEAVQRALRGL